MCIFKIYSYQNELGTRITVGSITHKNNFKGNIFEIERICYFQQKENVEKVTLYVK